MFTNYTILFIRNIETFGRAQGRSSERGVKFAQLLRYLNPNYIHTSSFCRHIIYTLYAVRSHKIIICSSFTRNGYFNLYYDLIVIHRNLLTIYVSFDGGINLIQLFLQFVEMCADCGCVRETERQRDSEREKKEKENIAIEHAQCTFNLIHVS